MEFILSDKFHKIKEGKAQFKIYLKCREKNDKNILI